MNLVVFTCIREIYFIHIVIEITKFTISSNPCITICDFPCASFTLWFRICNYTHFTINSGKGIKNTEVYKTIILISK